MQQPYIPVWAHSTFRINLLLPKTILVSLFLFRDCSKGQSRLRFIRRFIEIHLSLYQKTVHRDVCRILMMTSIYELSFLGSNRRDVGKTKLIEKMVSVGYNFNTYIPMLEMEHSVFRF